MSETNAKTSAKVVKKTSTRPSTKRQLSSPKRRRSSSTCPKQTMPRPSPSGSSRSPATFGRLRNHQDDGRKPVRLCVNAGRNDTFSFCKRDEQKDDRAFALPKGELTRAGPLRRLPRSSPSPRRGRPTRQDDVYTLRLVVAVIMRPVRIVADRIDGAAGTNRIIDVAIAGNAGTERSARSSAPTTATMRSPAVRWLLTGAPILLVIRFTCIDA
jgi:hypothetical protein